MHLYRNWSYWDKAFWQLALHSPKVIDNNNNYNNLLFDTFTAIIVDIQKLQQQRKRINNAKNKINNTLPNTSIKAENIQIKCY